jgi:leucyl/phenylalanyl-tRNA--protein transferase
MLLSAYAQGIFPWPSDDLPFAWYSPDPRFVLPVNEVHISRSLRRVLNQQRFSITWDTAFEEVIKACSMVPRRGEAGTWITAELRAGFLELHRQGFAHSVECWRDGHLVGGVYGLGLGTMFCGESMFFLESNASKVALIHLAERLRGWGYQLIDCQVHTEHMERLGARDWDRERFLEALRVAMEKPTVVGKWTESSSHEVGLDSGVH